MSLAATSVLLLATMGRASGASLESQEGQRSGSVRVESRGGELLCSIDATRVSAETLLVDLVDRAGLEIIGVENLEASDPVNVHLEERHFSHVVHTILGSVGLRAHVDPRAVHVVQDTSSFPTTEELEDLAELAYLRALKLFPDNEHSVAADMALAEIQEARGNLSAARSRYEYLIEAHPDSDLVPQALLQAGLILQRMGEWTDAALKFTTLGNLDLTPALHSLAQKELARCSVKLAKFRQAQYMIKSLDTNFPTSNPSERRDRLLIKAAALNGTGDHVEALRCLDRFESLGPEKKASAMAMELRGRALELSGLDDRASLAWLNFAYAVPHEERGHALAEAARLSLAADNELGAIFIGRYAHRSGQGEAVAPYEQEARIRLGLPVANLAGGRPEQKVERARRFLERGMYEQAWRTIAPVQRLSGFLDQELRQEVLLVYARSVAAASDLDQAIEILRTALESIQEEDERIEVYLLAAELLEQGRRFDEAAAAYGGEL